jgi:hypothetical protein
VRARLGGWLAPPAAGEHGWQASLPHLGFAPAAGLPA